MKRPCLIARILAHSGYPGRGRPRNRRCARTHRVEFMGRAAPLQGEGSRGKLADLTLVDVHLARIDPAGLKSVRPVMTILGNRLEREAKTPPSRQPPSYSM